MRKLLILCFLFLCNKVNCSCYAGWIPDPQRAECILAVLEPKLYMDAVEFCLEVSNLEGTLIKITNTLDNVFVNMLANETNSPIYPWIGIEKDVKNWVYTDGSSLDYINWAPGQPTNSSADRCAVMQFGGGKWESVDCTTDPRPFFCSMKMPKDTTTPKHTTKHTTKHYASSCDPNWIYFPTTRFCYFLQNFTSGGPDGWILYDFPTAEANCANRGAHLASIHSAEENDFLLGLIQSNVANVPVTIPCGRVFCHIGLVGDGFPFSGYWTDNTRVDWTDYSMDQPQEQPYWYWKIVNDTSCNKFGWDSTMSTYTAARFICKKFPN